jgi:Transposase, Mutator family
MASTLLLATGQKVRMDVLKSHWLKFNIDSGNHVHTSQSMVKPKARYFSVCYSAPVKGWKNATNTCRAHIKACGNSPEHMVITSIDLNHTCDPNTEERRRQNYRTRDISNLSEAVALWEPAKSGNAKQFSRITKTSTGVDMKTGQASRAVRKKSFDSTEVHLAHYFWLPSLFNTYQGEDPDGTYQLEWNVCGWNPNLKQFHRAYLCMSIAKHFWRHAVIEMCVCDGTFTRSNAFKHIILIATTYDPNNNITIMALAVVDCENAHNWVWFKELLERDFPGITVWMSDADKGIRSNAFSLSMSQSEEAFVLSRCARHLSENCRENCGGKMNEGHKSLIIELGKSLNEEVYQKRLEAIRKVNDKWAEWLDERKHEFVAYTFLDKGIRRYGKVTSNGTETINGVFGEARSYPLVYLLEHVLQ